MYSARSGKAAQRAGLVILGVGALATLTGCGTGSPAAAPTVTVTVTSTQPAGTGAAATPGSDPAASSGPAASTVPAASTGPGTCPPSALHVSLGTSQGAAGTFYRVIVLTNTSTSACTLYGYPGVSFVTRPGGSVIGAPAGRNPLIHDALITLQPGAAASALSGLVDTGALSPAQCRPGHAVWLQIYPPGDRGALFARYPAEVCTRPGEKFMTITPVHAGASGSF